MNFLAKVSDLTLIIKILIFRHSPKGTRRILHSGIFLQATAPPTLRTVSMTTRKFLQLWLKKLFSIKKGYEGIRSIVGKRTDDANTSVLFFYVCFVLIVCQCTTRCQILCSMRLQCVSKILTPRRMLKKSSLIAKINRWNNSFQNMYDML